MFDIRLLQNVFQCYFLDKVTQGLAALVKFQRSRRLLGVCYIVVKVILIFCVQKKNPLILTDIIIFLAIFVKLVRCYFLSFPKGFLVSGGWNWCVSSHLWLVVGYMLLGKTETNNNKIFCSCLYLKQKKKFWWEESC